ncbi:MAG: DNA translocase FtsK 4TM domain-containing protein [Chloroflexota bacterium]|nr:DNA translocase FtsK 4TM domain-containing protein [Chloroflexota bacterium]
MAKKTSTRSQRKSTSRSKSRKKTAKKRTSDNFIASFRNSLGELFSLQGILTRERKTNLLGLFLLVVGFLTILSLLTTQEGLIGNVWVNLLQQTFGWGMFIVPLALILGGAGILLRKLRGRLPGVEPEKIVGAASFFLLALVLMHALLGATTFTIGKAIAQEGRGGGIIGAAIYALMVSSLGVGGALVVIAAWLLVSITFIIGISLPEVVDYVLRSWGWVLQQFTSIPSLSQSTTDARRTDTPPQALDTAPSTPSEAAQPQQGMDLPASLQSEVVGVSPQRQWTLPEVAEILEPGAESRADETFDRERARLIEETLRVFGAPARVVEINRGPVITQFGVEPDFIEGRGGRRTKVKVSKISSLADDLALALAAPSIRIEAPVPSKGYVGIEVPNTDVSLVALRDVIEAQNFQKMRTRLKLGLGIDVSGGSVIADLAAMPHLLIAGTTGSGKSVCVNAIISCLLLQNTPDELKFVMVDPKRVELTYYNGIPHLMAPVVVELERVVSALQWVSREMDRRYHLFAQVGVRNIGDYNRRVNQSGGRSMHYIVVVIDELADLMMLAPHETEMVITRLAQLARATGIHLVIATQRPSVDVVTGLIKANFPARIAFAVASSVDSRVILDQPGAERLLGRGDMLFQAPDASAPIRMQGAYVSEDELNRLIQYWKIANLGEEIEEQPVTPVESIPPGVDLKQAPLWDEMAEEDDDLDPLFNEAVSVIRGVRRASISLLQRHLRIGYTRSARLVDQLEERGIIGPAKSGSQPREVLDYGDLTPPDEQG